MATHSSVLVLRIPGMGEPGGLPSLGSHRVRHDWSNLAAAAAATIFTSPPEVISPFFTLLPSSSPSFYIIRTTIVPLIIAIPSLPPLLSLHLCRHHSLSSLWLLALGKYLRNSLKFLLDQAFQSRLGSVYSGRSFVLSSPLGGRASVLWVNWILSTVSN